MSLARNIVDGSLSQRRMLISGHIFSVVSRIPVSDCSVGGLPSQWAGHSIAVPISLTGDLESCGGLDRSIDGDGPVRPGGCPMPIGPVDSDK